MSDNQRDDDLENFDDVSDFDDAQTEEAYGEEESWDDSFDDQDGEAAEDDVAPIKKTKKKSSLGNLIVIGGVLVVGGAVAFMMLGGKPPAPVAPGQPAEMAQAVPDVPMGAPLETPVVQDVVDQAVPPMPTPMAQPDSAPAAEVLAAVPTPAPPIEQAVENPIRMPSASDLMLKAAPTETLSDSAEPVQLAGSDQVSGAPAVQQDPQLSQKMDQVLSRLDQMEMELRSVKDAAPVTAPQDNGVTQDISGLKDSIARLEKMVADLAKQQQKQAVEKPRAVVPAAEKPAAQVEEESDLDVAPTPQVLGTPRENEQEAAPTVSTRWVLKGAQPGQAMVSLAGESDMQTVKIGDSLPGIGKITSITFADGRWVVTGTTGLIRQ